MGEVIASPSASVAATFPGSGDETFGQLKSDVAAFYGMEDDPAKLSLAGRMMSRIMDELNMKQNWIFNLITSPNIPTIGGVDTYAVPSDFWKVYNVRKTDNIDYQLTVLRQKGHDTLFQSQNNISGFPYVFIIKDTFRDGTFKIFPIPDAGYQIQIHYFKLIARPQNDSDFLDLPRPYQVVPFYGALSRFGALTDKYTGASYWQKLYKEAYDSMKLNDEDLGDEDSLRFFNIEEVYSRSFSYLNPAARPRAYDLF